MVAEDSPRWVSEVKQIPSLPKEVHHLIQALTNEEIDYRRITQIIEAHPSIAARLIALANSAWAAPVKPITTLESACVRLGLSIVRSVSIGLAVIAPFNCSKCPEFDMRRYWISSMLVADGAALLAADLPHSDQIEQTARTAGVLHNIGLLCLAHQMPKETQQALIRVADDPELNVRSALLQTLQADYCEVGGQLADSLGIPERLVRAIRYHRDLNYQGQYWEFARLVGYSAIMVGAIFRNQDILPQYEAASELPFNHAFKMGVFNSLQERFDKTSELAKLLFN